MTSLRFRYLFLLALLFTVLTTHVLANESLDDENAENFQILLNSVSEDRLHAVLHDYDPTKFKHGVFQEDRTAMEAVHRDDAAMATKLIHLAKRQSNSTSSSKASDTPLESPNKTPTPPAESPTAAATTAGGKASDTPKNAATSQILSTFITSQIVRTSTAPDGSRSTVTEFTVVGAPIETPGAQASKTRNGTPSLQTGAAIRKGIAPMGGIVGGVIVGIFVL
ncbi:hypothetical protein FGG08_003942 [Glutinoglossum americanum]|uniref:Uncharacterized protein n=1 Tax=Glutinoglossum americanum TaxID=1670608 RepID=A0A9P8I6A1_9PEZI|nr:hypothetical protein FGG08_003942 [Glutinoglossum americanum]